MRNTNDLAQLVDALAQLAEQIATREADTQPEPRPLPPRVLLTVETAAKQLSIGRTTMYALIKAGAITTVRIGHRRLVPADAITAYIKQLTHTAIAA